MIIEDARFKAAGGRRLNYPLYPTALLPLILLLFLLPQTVHAADRLPPLRRGINLSSWFANAPRQPLFAADFAGLQHAGFDNVRLPFNPELFGFTLNSAEKPVVNFVSLDAALAEAARHHIAVVLDIHPRKAFMERLETDAGAEEKFKRLWQIISAHYRAYPPAQLAFELLNEPQYYHRSARYNALVKRVVGAIRANDGSRLIIIAAPYGSSIAGLSSLDTLPDDHVIYDFHFYEPYIVTHQGIRTGFDNSMMRYFRGVPYPAGKVTGNAAMLAPGASNPALAAKELSHYVSEGWNRQMIAARIAQAKAWANTHQATLICGEFGVMRAHIDTASRYRWIADTREALDRSGIGWQLWDYTDLFGITTLAGEIRTDAVDGSVRFIHPERGRRTLEKEALKALGLDS